MTIPTILELLQAGVHFGHQKSRWHPKMKDYIFTERSGVHIIDLEKTLVKLEAAVNFVRETAQNGGVILFIGTKNQGRQIMKKYAEACETPYITERWIGGLFTNFANVNKLIKKYKDLKEKQEAGVLKKYTKQEQMLFSKEVEKLQKSVGGLAELKKLPDAVFVLDAKQEKTAMEEAINKKIKIVGFCDTNINPERFDYPIPANDDAIKSIELIAKTISEAIKEGKANINVNLGARNV